MTKWPENLEVLAIIDTQIFVPALALQDPASAFYSCAFRKCWKFVFSEEIIVEYSSVMHKLGFPATAVYIEQSRLTVWNKMRLSQASGDSLPQGLAPRKDRHIVAPCHAGDANVIVTNDSGILEKAELIHQQTGGIVLSLDGAQRMLATLPDCPNR
ncbi:MAG: PIN domain-containing protein [Candidatus Sulfotelmatobacter sp.]